MGGRLALATHLRTARPLVALDGEGRLLAWRLPGLLTVQRQASNVCGCRTRTNVVPCADAD